MEVWVLDTSFLIKSKREISIFRQWEAFKRLEEMVEGGRIAMPNQVIDEITNTKHPDLPGAWAPGVRPKMRHAGRVADRHQKRVMEVASGVIDHKKRVEDADPYVLALALQLQTEGRSVCVVAEDFVDRYRLSLATACRRLGLAWIPTREFLEGCGIPVQREDRGG